MIIPPLKDSLGRSITYLRLSVTDRCSFNCVYCTPPEGLNLLPANHYLEPGEMEQLVRALSEMGVWKLRITGGEPLMRKDIVSLIARFSSIPGIRDLALTTNGEKLPELAYPLKEAGLQRINISCDSLDPKRFFEITRSRSFFRVWSGIHRSLEAGLKVKINVVLLKGITNQEIDAFARFALHFPLEVRFIEFMPLCGLAWKPELVVPVDQVRSHLQQQFLMVPLKRGNEVAESYALANGRGRIGFIGSMTEPFCSKCSRLRISAAGKVQLCLFSSVQYNLAPLLKKGAPLSTLQQVIRSLVLRKPASHPWVSGPTKKRPEDNAKIRLIGG